MALTIMPDATSPTKAQPTLPVPRYTASAVTTPTIVIERLHLTFRLRARITPSLSFLQFMVHSRGFAFQSPSSLKERSFSFHQHS